MKNAKRHIGLLLGLFLMAGLVLVSSVSAHYFERKSADCSIEKKHADADKNKEAKVDASEGWLAIVVSVATPEFCKAVVFQKPDFIFIVQEVLVFAKNSFASDYYFETLFTHIIAPNAP